MISASSGFGLAVHAAYGVIIFVHHAFTLDLHGGGDFILVHRELIREQRKFLDFFIVRQVLGALIDPLPVKLDNIRMPDQFGPAVVFDIVILRIFLQGFKRGDDQGGNKPLLLTDHHYLLNVVIRAVIRSSPFSSNSPTSPDLNHPSSVNASALTSGLL